MSFDTFDHTADIGLVVRGSNLEDLFTQAALGLTSLLIDPSSVRAEGVSDLWRAEGEDPVSLLVRWLNETLFQITVNKMLPARLTVRHLAASGPGPCAVVAEALGELRDPLRHPFRREIKAATFHELSLLQGPEGWEARVILDV